MRVKCHRGRVQLVWTVASKSKANGAVGGNELRAVPIDAIGAAVRAVVDDDPRDGGGRAEVDVPVRVGLDVGAGATGPGIEVLAGLPVERQPTWPPAVGVLRRLRARASLGDVDAELVEHLDLADGSILAGPSYSS